MLVSVIYNENKNCGTVHSSRLESLIRSGMIFAFRQTREWVIVGTDEAGGMKDAVSRDLKSASDSLIARP